MPIYEYRCAQCGHQEDALQKLSDAPLTECPACNEPALVKLVSAPNFRLKGGGWYETDFKKDNKRNLADDGGKGDKPKAADTAKDTAKDGGTKAAADGKSASSSSKSADASGASAKSVSKKSGDGGKAA